MSYLAAGSQPDAKEASNGDSVYPEKIFSGFGPIGMSALSKDVSNPFSINFEHLDNEHRSRAFIIEEVPRNLSHLTLAGFFSVSFVICSWFISSFPCPCSPIFFSRVFLYSHIPYSYTHVDVPSAVSLGLSKDPFFRNLVRRVRSTLHLPTAVRRRMRSKRSKFCTQIGVSFPSLLGNTRGSQKSLVSNKSPIFKAKSLFLFTMIAEILASTSGQLHHA
jgi:hypothetical protein